MKNKHLFIKSIVSALAGISIAVPARAGDRANGYGGYMERKGVVTFQGNPVTLIGPELRAGDPAPGFTVLDTNFRNIGLRDFSGKIKLISVTPSLDTPVCDMQARQFNDAAGKLPGDLAVINISMDLPFAISRFCSTAGIEKVRVLSDHRYASFGTSYGVLIKEMRLLSRAVFIIDKTDTIRYVQIVPEMTDHLDFESALDIVAKIEAQPVTR